MNLSTTTARSAALRMTGHGLIALLAASALTACGDDSSGDSDSPDGSSSPAPDAQGPAETDGPAATDEGTAATSEGTDQVAGDPVAGDFCTELESLVTTSANFFEVTFAEISGKPAPTAEEARKAADPVAERIVKASLAAPADLADDLETMGTYLLSATGAVEAANYDVGSIDNFPQPSAKVNAAEDVINEYARTECGFDPEASDEG